MRFRVPLTFVFIATFGAGRAATITVKTIADLQAAIAGAAAGDMIIVANDNYSTTAPLTITRAGTPSAPITIKAESVGGVTLTGTDGFNVKSPAAHVVIEGFVFAHASGKNTIAAGTSHVRFTRNTFQCAGDGPYLNVVGDDAEIDRNEFRDKKTVGNMISVTGIAPQVARRLWIHHNYFHDFAAAGVNGAETIRFGLSGLSMSDGHGLVEHNLFVRCVGENELISNKSGANTYRYNTFLDSRGAQLTLRHGNECSVYGNYFRGLAGLRIFGDRHWVFSNYFEGNSVGIQLGNGGAEVADGAPLTSHDRPDNCVIAFNTLVNNTRNYIMDARNNGLGAVSTTFANNVIQGGGPAAEIHGPNTGATWANNLLWQTKGAGDIPAGGFVESDPKLAPDQNGIFRLQKASPAIDAATGTFPAAKFDFDGQLRTIAKDIGADEFWDAPVVARILTPADVGPKSGM
jgi:poly(beta-D-mannuronate) lyase